MLLDPLRVHESHAKDNLVGSGEIYSRNSANCNLAPTVVHCMVGSCVANHVCPYP